MSLAADGQLVARVLLDDDRNAFGELVVRHQGPVRSLLRRLTCGDHALADDLAQETFLRAYLKLHTYRVEARLGTWLYRIAFNLFLGSRRRRQDPVVDSASGLPSPFAPSTTEIDLERAMAVLTEAERAAIVLSYAGELTHAEIAAVLGCPLGTVKTHILRGKEKLKARLTAGEGKVRHAAP